MVRASEIIVAMIIGALLLGVGYELGQSGAPAPVEQAAPIDRKLLESEIKVSVEVQLAQRQEEMTKSVIAMVEESLPRPVKSQPETVSEGTQGESGSERIRRLEEDLDKLTAGGLASLAPEPVAKQVNAEEKKRRREIFSPAQLREYEEARKRMLDERRRIRERDEKRKK